MKVYIATDGDYSDYHIDGVFSSKEELEKVFPHDYVEEWTVDEYAGCAPTQVFTAYVDDRGTVRSIGYSTSHPRPPGWRGGMLADGKRAEGKTRKIAEKILIEHLQAVKRKATEAK